MGCAVGLAPPQVLLVELAQRELEVARNRVEVHVDRVILVGMAGATLHPPAPPVPPPAPPPPFGTPHPLPRPFSSPPRLPPPAADAPRRSRAMAMPRVTPR